MGRVDITEIRRREIIEAASRVFSEKGYHNSSMADIATELQVGHGTLYRYFNSKLDIASSVIDEVIMRITEVVAAEPPEGITTVEEYRARLEGIGNRFFELLEEYPDIQRLFFYEALSIDETVAERINTVFTLAAAYTESYLKNGIENGFLKPDIHTHEASLAINAMLFEAARRLSQEPEIAEESKRAWFETITGLMLEGLAV